MVLKSHGQPKSSATLQQEAARIAELLSVKC